MTNTSPIQPGEEIIRISVTGTVSYEYCSADGEVFRWADKSLEEARMACAKWLVAKG